MIVALSQSSLATCSLSPIHLNEKGSPRLSPARLVLAIRGPQRNVDVSCRTSTVVEWKKFFAQMWSSWDFEMPEKSDVDLTSWVSTETSSAAINAVVSKPVTFVIPKE